MNLHIENLKSDLYKNVRRQIEIQNSIVDCIKGSLITKRRYNEDYYYLSYRDFDKIKTDYLGKLSSEEVERIRNEIENRRVLKEELKELKQEELELRRIINAVNSKALIKRVYDVMDIIVLIRPVIVWSKAKEVYLFGSYARGGMNERSDINLEFVGSTRNKEEIETKIAKITNKNVNILFSNENIDEETRATIDEEKFLIYGGIN